MTNILGISAYYHDSAAALLTDDRIVCAAQEERFTRVKHDARFPVNAVGYCLREAGIRASDLDYVGFYEKPLLRFERLLETYLAVAPAGWRSFATAMPLWLNQKLYLQKGLREGLGGEFKKRIIFTEHHESHAASAFFPSPFEEAAILTVDGVGEWATASCGYGRGNKISLISELRFPHSLGLLYSAFTYFCGFKVNSGEYKLMGLAPYGQPRYADLIVDKLLDLKDDGSFRMDMSYFDYCQGLHMTSRKFAQLFGGPARRPETELTQREMDLAASVQAVTEEVMLRMARYAHRLNNTKNLCIAGGVALNCVGNGRILREGPYENIWVQPAAGDAGGALGAALFIQHQLLDRPRAPRARDQMAGSLLGPRYTNDQIREFLEGVGARFSLIAGEAELCDEVAALIAREKVVGWFQGRMEFGPRALGSRSILGDARSARMQSEMNLRIKFRESFRPFAPAVLEERVHEYFMMRSREQSPYMLLVAPVHERQQRPLSATDQEKAGLAKRDAVRSTIPAVTHVDLSARVQTVDEDRHGRFYRLLKAFEKQTDCPVMINTSFNVRGEPIVCTPGDAYRCFRNTNMDVLVLEDFVLLKDEQPNAGANDAPAYLSKFQLD